MPLETSNVIIIILTTIILILIFVVIKLNIQFFKEKKRFNKKVEVLREIIIQLSKNELGKLDKIRLSDGLREKIKIINTTLNSDMYELNRELFEILSKNNLV